MLRRILDIIKIKNPPGIHAITSLLSLTLILIIAAIIYYPALGFKTIWSDVYYGGLPEFISRRGFDPERAKYALTHGSPSWGVIPTLLLLCSHWLFAGDAAAFRGLPILLHMINVCLIFVLAGRVVERFSLRKNAALYSTLIFAVHPALIESVAHTPCLPQAVGAMLALLALVYQGSSLESSWRTLITAALVALAVFSDQSVLGAPILVAVWLSALASGARCTPKHRRSVITASFIAALWGLCFSYMFNEEPSIGRLSGLGYGRTLLEYLAVIAWPFSTLRPIHFWLDDFAISSSSGILSLAALLISLGIICRSVFRPQSSMLFLSGALASLLIMVPLTQASLPPGTYAAERFLILPIAMVCLALTFPLSIITSAPESLRRLAFFPVVAWVSACLLIIVLRLPRWSGEATIRDWAIMSAPDSEISQAFFLEELANAGENKATMTAAIDFLRDYPRHSEIWRVLGYDQLAAADFDEAIKSFNKAIEFDPKSPGRLADLAGALYSRGEKDAAHAVLNKALAMDPRSFEAHLRLGMFLKAEGQMERAEKELQEAADLGSDDDRRAIAKL